MVSNRFLIDFRLQKYRLLLHWRQNLSKSGMANNVIIELISKKVVNLYKMSVLEPEDLGFNAEYLMK